MIEQAEERGDLRPGMTIVEPTSGNTGIGLAMVAAVKGYRLIIALPEGVSEERQKLLQAFGAEVVLTPAFDGMRGTIEKAMELKSGRNDFFVPQQFENPANPEVHRQTTAKEIIEQMDGVPDAFVAGVGTGGTITGVGEVFKSLREDVLVVGVEPRDSAVLSGGEPGPTEIDGLGAGMIPPVMNVEVLDRVIAVSNTEARAMARRLAKEEGILAGISSGAATHAATLVARDLGPKHQVVVVLPDTGERYLGTFLFG
jgi:cysteine synthase A